MDARDDEAAASAAEEDSQPPVSGLGQTALVEAAAPEWLGRVIDDRYRVTAMLGEGGMGAVYVAQHLTLHKEVALKVVRAELAGNGEVATRFAREAMATAQFEHPHVASAIDYGTLPEGGAYFVMQLVRGKSLRALLARRKRLSWRKTCELLAQVADALSAARAAEIIHRDLKPDNILVEAREDGSDLVKVLDFGIAHVAPRDAPAPEGAQANRELTRVGTVMGTPGYMSPEQAVGDKVDHRTDLYALGVMLWECIAGRELWTGEDLTAVITRQLSESVPRLRDCVDDPTLPPELDALVQRLTAKKAADRPEHAGEVRDTLRRLAMTEISRGSWPDSLTRASDYLREVSVRLQALPKTQRHRQLLLGAGAGAGLLLLVALIALIGGDDETAGQRQSGERTAATDASPSAEQPAMLERVVIAASNAVKPAMAAVAPKGGIPDELEDDVEAMLEGKRVRERRAAARRILDYKEPDEIYLHLRVIAEFETARGCRPRKEAIGKMVESPDERFLPPLRRIHRARKTGCGFLSLQDCYQCIRGDVRQAIASIREATGSEAEPGD